MKKDVGLESINGDDFHLTFLESPPRIQKARRENNVTGARTTQTENGLRNYRARREGDEVGIKSASHQLFYNPKKRNS